jgi:hypothetical protein
VQTTQDRDYPLNRVNHRGYSDIDSSNISLLTLNLWSSIVNSYSTHIVSDFYAHNLRSRSRSYG